MKTKTLLAQFAAVILFSTLLSARPAFAQSLRFDGVNDFVNVPNSGSLTIVGRITVEAWVNRAAVGAQHSVVEKFGAAGSGQGGYDLRISAGDRVQFETRDDGGRAVTVTGATAIPANTWVHIAGTWDGANNRVFVNGVQDGIVANGRPPRAGNTALKIGARGNDNGTPMNGGIDDARIWNVARTAAQIAANSTNCLAGDEAGLVALWHMDEGTGLTTADATANHNNGTLVNAVAWNPVGAISCVPAGPSFDALEIFTAPAPVLAVPPVNFAGAVVNDTREFPTNLPPGSIASIVFPGATVLAINTAGAGQEWVLDIGSETVRVYTHAGTRIVNSPVVGSVVKMVGSRTIAPGPIVADVITLRTVAVTGACISFVFQGVVDLATPTKWTVGGFVFNIVGAPVPTDIALDAPLVVGTTVVDVQFIPTPGAFAGPPPAIPFDALEIFPPAAAVLAVPAPLFPNPVANTVVLPSPMPPGTIAVAVIPGGTVVAVNVNAANGGQEWVIDTGVGIARVYTAADTVIRAPATVGGIVKVVADRTLAPGPLVAEVITARQVAVGGLDFLFLYQGVVTRADPDVWTIGAVDFNIVPVTGALPTDIALDAPLVGGTTVVTVEFLLAPGARLDPPTVSVTAIDAAAAETASDPAVFRITRANTTFIPLTVSFTLTGTAINGTDYSPVPLTVSMPVGTASMDVTITPIDDAVLDPNETVILTLASGTNYIVGSPNTATAIIEDNEAALSIVATKADAAETGPTNALFTVSRTGSTAADLTVSYTIGGTASNGVDYLTLSGSVLIPAGFSSATITVTPIDDAIAEGRETIILTLVLPPGFGTVAGSATASILDNDAAPTFALQFNGVNQRVDINGGGSLNLVGNLTVEAWINRAAVGVQHSVFEKFGAANSGVGGYDLRISGDRVQFEVRDDGGRAVTVTGATAIPANTWVHVAGHWDGANLRVFVNGAQDGILANNRPPRAGNTLARIGARGDDAGTPFNGQIDEVRVWNVARSAAQINANRNTCIPGNAGGLAGYWRLDNGAGAIATDSSPNGNNGTLINGPTWVPSTSPVVCVP